MLEGSLILKSSLMIKGSLIRKKLSVSFSRSESEPLHITKFEYEPMEPVPLKSWLELEQKSSTKVVLSDEEIFFEEVEDLVSKTQIPYEIRRSPQEIRVSILSLNIKIKTLSEKIGMRYVNDGVLEDVKLLSDLVKQLESHIVHAEKSLRYRKKTSSSRRKKTFSQNIDDAISRAFIASEESLSFTFVV